MFPQCFTNLAQSVVKESQLHAESILILSPEDVINCLLLISLCCLGSVTVVMNDTVTTWTRKLMIKRQLQKKQVLMSAIHPRSQQDLRRRLGRI